MDDLGKEWSEKDVVQKAEYFWKMKEEGKIAYMDVDDYEEIILYYTDNMELDLAREIVDIAQQVHPNETQLILAEICILIADKQSDKAREMLDNIETTEEFSFEIQLMHVELCLLEYRYEEAYRIIDSFIDNDEIDEYDQADIGIVCSNYGVNDRAKYWLERSLEIIPDYEESLEALCHCYIDEENHEKVIELYNKLLDLDPYSEKRWLKLGQYYYNRGQYDKAIEAFDFALINYKKEAETSVDEWYHALISKGHTYYQLENYEEAANSYMLANELGNPKVADDGIVLFYIGMCYMRLENWENAEWYVSKSLSMSNPDRPTYMDIMIIDASCKFHLDKKEEAFRTSDRIQEYYPNHPAASIYMGQYYMMEGDLETALEYFKKATTISPTDKTWFQIGFTAIHCNEYEIAALAFQQVKDINPDYIGLDENIDFVNSQLPNSQDIITAIQLAKERIEKIFEKEGWNIRPIDIDKYICEAREEGKSDEEIEEMMDALKLYNQLMDMYNKYIEEEEEE